MAKISIQDPSCKKDIKRITEDSTIPLLDLAIGRKAIIHSLHGGHVACKRLNELGLVPEAIVEMVRKINHGPVMIRVKGSKLALGRGLALKVQVIPE
jgi:Fe2+ transport system protein FeoA